MSIEKFIPVEQIKTQLKSDVAQKEIMTETSGCEKREPYVLMVLGDSMEPEFMNEEIIVIEPDLPPQDGAFVIAQHNDEHIFRQLLIKGDQWIIHPLNSNYPDQVLSGPDDIHGVITQKKSPGGRKNRKNYAY
jgi:SOS-response transcriptional repressor LexA